MKFPGDAAPEGEVVGCGWSGSVSRILFRRTAPPAVVIHLRPVSPPALSGLPGDLGQAAGAAVHAAGHRSPPIWPCTGWGLPGRRVTATPVRSYRTFSPLPPEGGGVFSVALSVGSPRLPVRKHPALWCSDFPLRSVQARAQRPPDPLHLY